MARPSVLAGFGRLEVGALIAQRQLGEAAALAERRRAANPGSYDTQSIAGDAQLALGKDAEAAERYMLAARVRLPDNLVLRMAAALTSSGQGDAAEMLVEGYLTQSPTSRGALRRAASFAAQRGDWDRSALLLDTLRKSGGEDVRLLADLALARLQAGDPDLAEETAREAYRLQPSSAIAARAWGLSLAALQQRRVDAGALLDKAKSLGGDTPEIAEARRQLGS